MKNKRYPLYNTIEVSNFKELLDTVVLKYGDNPAFGFTKRKEIKNISYKQFREDVHIFAADIARSGATGERVALLGENTYLWIVSYFAVVLAGRVIVPLDKGLCAQDLQGIINDSQCAVLIYADTYNDIAQELEIKHKRDMNKDISMVIKNPPSIQGDRVEYDTDKNRVSAIIYTSGTTGKPKGVMLSQENLVSNACAGCKSFYLGKSTFMILPMHHTFAFTGNVLVPLISGTTIYINLSLKRIGDDLKIQKPESILAVPLFLETFYNQIWETARSKNKEKSLKLLVRLSDLLLKVGIDLRKRLFAKVIDAFGGNLTMIVSGGAPLDPKYTLGFRSFGIHIADGYGITECSPVVSVNRNKHFRDGSVGLILPCCDVKISSSGEILVRGGNVMLGYYKNEDATRKVFDGEYFKTGDIGHMDSDGFLYITGRIKNMIITPNGENVYPEELEQMISQIPAVKEVLVKADGNKLVAHIYSEDAGVSELETAVNEINASLPPYKRIDKVVVRRTEFSKTTTRKIKRNVEE